jgi:carbamoyl-phosphate synthase small subunit
MEKKFMKVKKAKAKLKLIKSSSNMLTGSLLLEDGSFWKGIPFGAKATQVGELVFHTSLTGYQEILTDPSYRKQIVTFSAVQIGNEGFHDEDFESEKIWASGCLVRDYSEPRYHWRKQKSLTEVLKNFGVPGLSGIDTRRLILSLRNGGNRWGVVSTETSDRRELEKYFDRKLSMQGLSLTREVSTKAVYTWVSPSVRLFETTLEKNSGGLKRCVVMDFGVKRQILRYLIDSGFK